VGQLHQCSGGGATEQIVHDALVTVGNITQLGGQGAPIEYRG
jgi:hypothetical protein